MAGYTTDSNRAAYATSPVDADDSIGSDVVGLAASWNLGWSLGSMFSCVCSIDGLDRPKRPASAWSVDVLFSLDFVVDGFDGDSLFVLTIFLIDESRSSRDALGSRLKGGSVTPFGESSAKAIKLTGSPVLTFSAFS